MTDLGLRHANPPGGPRVLALLVTCALPLLAGCSIEKLAADNMVGVFVKVKEDFNRETIPQYAREAGPALLAQLNGFVLASPKNPELRLLQAEMNATFAFAFLEQENPTWATAHYRRAQAAALIALADVDAELARELPRADLKSLESLLADQDEDAVPALFWWSFARGAEVNLHRDDPQQILDLDRVDAVLGWVLKADETFFNGGPHLFFAIRHTLLPATLGGQPEVGLEHFNAVQRITGGKHLLAKVLQAQYYVPGLAATPRGATAEQIMQAQRSTWEAWYGLLSEVAEAKDDVWPEQALTNAVARQRARALLKDPEEYNIIPPPDAKNPYASGADSGDGDWGDGGDDDGDWGDGE